MYQIHRQTDKRQKIRIAAAGVLIVLFALGMAIDEGDYLAGKHTSVTAYLQVYSAFPLLLVYIVPFDILMKRLGQKYGLSGFELLTAVACGAFIPAAFANVR